MHLLDHMTPAEQSRYFAAREERMAAAHPVERFRLWCHPSQDLIFFLGLGLAFTIYGLPISFCLVNLALWVQSADRRWSFWIFMVLAPISLLWMILLGSALVLGAVR